ncbi:2452_t:CDS:2, partial [Diversispora eburnea]
PFCPKPETEMMVHVTIQPTRPTRAPYTCHWSLNHNEICSTYISAKAFETLNIPQLMAYGNPSSVNVPILNAEQQEVSGGPILNVEQQEVPGAKLVFLQAFVEQRKLEHEKS